MFFSIQYLTWSLFTKKWLFTLFCLSFKIHYLISIKKCNVFKRTRCFLNFIRNNITKKCSMTFDNSMRENWSAKYCTSKWTVKRWEPWGSSEHYTNIKLNLKNTVNERCDFYVLCAICMKFYIQYIRYVSRICGNLPQFSSAKIHWLNVTSS